VIEDCEEFDRSEIEEDIPVTLAVMVRATLAGRTFSG